MEKLIHRNLIYIYLATNLNLDISIVPFHKASSLPTFNLTHVQNHGGLWHLSPRFGGVLSNSIPLIFDIDIINHLGK